MGEPIWRPVVGFEGLYKINTTGKIISFHKRNYEKEISQRIDRAGYLTVRLSKQSETSTQYVHRLVAFAFVDNPENKPFVNHKNGDKLDNRDVNLEFVTHAENINHAYQIGSYNKFKLKIVDKCTGKSYNSIMQAAKDLNIRYSTCRYYLNGNIKINKTCLEYEDSSKQNAFKFQILGNSLGIVS